jgi:hypothetical protein
MIFVMLGLGVRVRVRVRVMMTRARARANPIPIPNPNPNLVITSQRRNNLNNLINAITSGKTLKNGNILVEKENRAVFALNTKSGFEKEIPSRDNNIERIKHLEGNENISDGLSTPRGDYTSTIIKDENIGSISSSNKSQQKKSYSFHPFSNNHKKQNDHNIPKTLSHTPEKFSSSIHDSPRQNDTSNLLNKSTLNIKTELLKSLSDSQLKSKSSLMKSLLGDQSEGRIIRFGGNDHDLEAPIALCINNDRSGFVRLLN